MWEQAVEKSTAGWLRLVRVVGRKRREVTYMKRGGARECYQLRLLTPRGVGVYTVVAVFVLWPLLVVRSCAFFAPSCCVACRASCPQRLSAMALELSSELSFMLEREGVDNTIQDKLREAGIVTVAKFAAIVDTQVELRELLKDEFGLDSKAGGLAVKAKVSSVLVAWAAAKKRAEKQADVDGEREARNEPKPIAVGDMHAMKKAFETRFWKLDEELTPCRGYLEKLLDRVEKDDLKAEKLSDVRSIRDDGDEQLRPVWDSSMALKAIKVTPTVPLPANPEQLRRRLSIMGAAWVFVAGAHGSRAYLKDADMHVWTEYANQLLGKFVMGLLVDDVGGPVAPGDWTIILDYEHEVRRDMVERMLGGMALGKALRAAWADPVVRDRYLVTPLQRKTMGRKRAADGAEGTADGGPNKEGGRKRRARERAEKERVQKELDYWRKQDSNKGGGKGKDKGNGKGRGMDDKNSAGCHFKTPDGKDICFKFNNPKETCNKPNCNRMHVCGVCFKQGVPMKSCDHKGRA